MSGRGFDDDGYPFSMNRLPMVAVLAVAVGMGAVPVGVGASATSVPSADVWGELWVIGQPPTIPEARTGTVEVVLHGAGSGLIAPILIRNGTDQTALNPTVTGVARDSDGNVVAAGQSLELAPAALAPGDMAFGYVYFDARVGDADEFVYDPATFEVTSSAPGHDVATVIEANLTAGRNGSPETVVGLVANETPDPIENVTVGQACFDDTGQLIYAFVDRPEADVLAPGATSEFTLPASAECTSALVASSTGTL